uniref:Nucleolus and neural progenitor protein-like N-terminal domain-containing protein n=1 Tax=Ditylenchus dipsaci TaxID=166011 RepID=A0A915EQF9_9BILA
MSLVRKRKQLQELNVDPKSEISRNMEKLLGFIDTCLERGSKRKMFSAKLLGVLVDLRLNKVGGCVAQKSCLLYDALVYKFGQSNRHQKFWKSTMQIYSQLKRINKINLIDYFAKIIKGLESSDFKSPPSRSTVCFLGSLILERIMKHLLTFNLMCIAIASDVASESLRQINHLSSLYDTLSEWLRKVHKRFPSSSSVLQLRSLNNKQGRTVDDKPKKLDKVREILDLLDCKVDEANEQNNVDDP